jgi:hypothetical protein
VKKQMKCRFIFLLCFTLGLCAWAQEKVITIKGKITDSDSGQPIPSANVYLKGGSSGTVSNTYGEFVFKIRESDKTDTLVVSCIGYKPYQALSYKLGDNLPVVLQPAVVELATVTIHSRTALDILQEAIQKIPDNYDTSDVMFTAFYREQSKLEDFEIAFTEAVVDIYKSAC